ncbi:hypothetical protein A3L12_02745 [Thermococcus sp. P6]|uniref:ABC transporter ATP-binding protein n=1 Tax=Thermococcus sp. P6 TaxID=122420 RepID=UPI000B5A1F77|nr:ATP-binding cassette domain-containing protein [Thermococcus sp. P6]ASJ10288.1 hypothetical protein A3L12_02745 [Thermococcus sp. P6]
MSNEVLVIRELVCGYDRPLLKASLRLREGEHAIVYGENGTGKTTFLKTIAGLREPFSGEVRILRKKPGRGKPVMREVFFLPEEISLPIELRVKDYVNMISDIYGEKPDEERISRGLEFLGLEHLYNRPIKELSQGQRRKVQLLTAYVLERKLTLLDDPVIGIDEGGEDVVKTIIRELTKDGAVLVTSRRPVDSLNCIPVDDLKP